MELIGTPFDGMYVNAQHSIGHPSAQYSTLAGALETPLSYHQPFGDGLGESLYLQAGGTLPGMSVGNTVRSDTAATDESLMMLRSSQEAFYAYQMGVPNSHPSGR